MTERLEDFICLLELEMSCEAASRIMKNLSESEAKRRELSTTIQNLKLSGAKLKDIASITGNDPKTVGKYM